MSSFDSVSNMKTAAAGVRFALPTLSREAALSLVRCATVKEASAVLANVPATAVSGITCHNVAVVWDVESDFEETGVPRSAYAYKLCDQEPWLPFEHLDMAALPVKFEILLERAKVADALECELLGFASPRSADKANDGDAEADDDDDAPQGEDSAEEPIEPIEIDGEDLAIEADDDEDWSFESRPENEGESDPYAEVEGNDGFAMPEGIDEPEPAPDPPRSKKRPAGGSSDSVLSGNPLDNGGNSGGAAVVPTHETLGKQVRSADIPAQAPRGLAGDREGRRETAGQGAMKADTRAPRKAEPKKRGAVAAIAAKAAEIAGGGKAAGAAKPLEAAQQDRNSDIDGAVENAKRSAEIAASGHVRQVEHGAISR